MTPPTSYRYAGGYNWCFGGVMTPPYSIIGNSSINWNLHEDNL